jgi:hypothetical protein
MTAPPGLSRRRGSSSCPRLLRPTRARGEVVRLPRRHRLTVQDAVDAFLDQHDVAPSTRRVYRTSIASLVAGLDPATAVGELSGRRWPAGFAAATPPRRRRPRTGSWPPCGPRSAGGAAAAGSLSTRPMPWSIAASGRLGRLFVSRDLAPGGAHRLRPRGGPGRERDPRAPHRAARRCESCVPCSRLAATAAESRPSRAPQKRSSAARTSATRSVSTRYSRWLPSARTRTSPASRRTLRCWEAAGRVAPTASAISEEVRSASQTSSRIARLVGLARARRVSSTAIN